MSCYAKEVGISNVLMLKGSTTVVTEFEVKNLGNINLPSLRNMVDRRGFEPRASAILELSYAKAAIALSSPLLSRLIYRPTSIHDSEELMT